MGITFTGKASHGYSAYIAGVGAYIGFVTRSANHKSKWVASYHGVFITDANGNVETFASRGDAAAALDRAARVERFAQNHYRVATDADARISAGDSPTYVKSLANLLSAIREAYPHEDAQQMYWDFIDHGETVLQNVNAARRERVERAATEAADALEEQAWREEQMAAGTAAVQSPEAVEDVFNATEDARIDAEADRIRAEWEAEVDAERSTVDSPESHEAPEEREITIDITREAPGRFMVTMVTVYPEARDAAGFTRNGTPFIITQAAYTSLKAARSMVDVMAREFATNPDRIWSAYTVTLVGLASLSSRLSTPSEPVPTYRAAGFPSLDAAIGAGYARQ